jgi:hypothetical protein
MPDYVVCTRAIKGGSFSSEPEPTRLFTVLKLSNVQRIGVAPRAGRLGLPESAPAKAVGVDCGARFLKAHPVTNPVVDPISHGRYFDDPVFLKDLTFTLAGDMDRNVIPTRLTTPTLSLAKK